MRGIGMHFDCSDSVFKVSGRGLNRWSGQIFVAVRLRKLPIENGVIDPARRAE
jgi:hypothetical protein